MAHKIVIEGLDETYWNLPLPLAENTPVQASVENADGSAPTDLRFIWDKTLGRLMIERGGGLFENARLRNDAVQSDGGKTDVQIELLLPGKPSPVLVKAQVSMDDRGLPKRGGANAVTAVDIKSPLTGKVLQVLVQNEQQVQVGDPLCIIEAMKMENKVFAPTAGTVTQLKCKGGESLSVGQRIMTIKP